MKGARKTAAELLNLCLPHDAERNLLSQWGLEFGVGFTPDQHCAAKKRMRKLVANERGVRTTAKNYWVPPRIASFLIPSITPCNSQSDPLSFHTPQDPSNIRPSVRFCETFRSSV